MSQPKTLFEYYHVSDPYPRQERAAIKEFDGNMPRQQAEHETDQEWESIFAAGPPAGKNSHEEKDNDEMKIPAPAAFGDESEGQGKRNTGSGLPWFRVDNLNGEPQAATIKKFIMEATQYSDFAAVITVNSNDYLLGLRTDKQGRDVYGVLYKNLGDDTDNWLGAGFELYPKQSEISGKFYLAARKVTKKGKK